uniref:Uncharacterized protein n=1 Tax=Siphoviridae sp. ctiJm4 TaxID=2827916 RepID=A0A8S5T1P4_9CAUD|nr:MAG TPA: hypothetical protein [Siphoviridae sp. ctiJm4]
MERLEVKIFEALKTELLEAIKNKENELNFNFEIEKDLFFNIKIKQHSQEKRYYISSNIEKIENHGNYRSRVSLPANGFFTYVTAKVRKGSKALAIACDNILDNADRIKTAILRSLVKNDIKTE